MRTRHSHTAILFLLYDISTTSDSSFSLVRADTVIPRTLSVAMRNVGGVYRPKDYPQAIESDPGKVVVVVILVVLALVALMANVNASLSRSTFF
jgi:hypothetical protein